MRSFHPLLFPLAALFSSTTLAGMPLEVISPTSSSACPYTMPAAMKLAPAGPTKTVWTTTTTTSMADVDCHGCATLVIGPPIRHALPQIVGAGGQGLNADYVINYQTTVTAVEPTPVVGYQCAPTTTTAVE